MSNVLLTIITTPQLEDEMMDWLLEHEEITGFSSSMIRGHGESQEQMTLAEQVTSRRNRVKFEINGVESDVRQIVGKLREDFGRADIYYWMTPVIESGHLCHPEKDFRPGR